MAKRMQELIEAGLVEDGELLRYKSKKGQVLALGRAREGGIEVEGKAKLLGFTAFEAVAGSGYHRPALHTHTIAGRNLQELQLQAAGVEAGGGGGPGVGSRTRHAQQAEQEAAALQLLEDDNDDLCHICGLGGDLVCCETCPAVYHADCVGLSGPPEGDYHCPRCRCTTCGKGGSDGIVPTGCQWVDCHAFVGPDTLQQQPRPFAGASSGGSFSSRSELAAAAGEAAAAAGGPEPMQVDGAAAPGTADFSRIVAAARKTVLQGGVPAEASQAAPAAQAAVAEAPPHAAVPCPVTGRWIHLGCFPPEFAEQLQHTAVTQPCISCALAATTSQRLAAVCAAGLLPLGSVAEGARAPGSSTAADAGSGGGGFAPLPLSLLIVRGAAVAAPADCRGHSPAYAPEQRRQLQVALSAALQVLHSCYDPLPDSRIGADMLPWLLRGAVLAGGRADYSAMHTALLYAGRVVVGVAVFRCFGEVAELPLLAVRPELQQRNGLGRLLLAAVEQLLLAAGAKVLLMPGFAADGSPYLPAQQAAAGGVQPAQPPPLLQAKWGYALATREQLLAACQHPLLRVPGVLLVSKELSSSSVLPPPRMPQRLQWAGSLGLDARQLLKQGLLAAVNIPRPAAEPSAGGSRPPRPSGGQRGAAVSKLHAANFVPTMPPAAAGAGAASAAAIGLTVEQSMLLRMYQQQMAAAAKSHAHIHVAAGPAAVYQQMLLQNTAQEQEQQVAQEQQAAGAAAPHPAAVDFALAQHLQQQLGGAYAAFLQQHIAAQQQQAQQQVPQPVPQPAPMQL